MWDWLVMALESSAARKRTRRATSSGSIWRLRAWRGEDFGDVLGGVPELLLAFGGDGAGEDGVDADVVGAELVGEGAGESDDGGLGGDVEGQAGGGDEPGDGTHVDDGAAAGGAHGGDDGLDGEEEGAEVGGDGAVPGLGGDFFDGVALVVGGVVDEDVDGGVGGEDLIDGGLEGGEVGEVAVDVLRSGAAFGGEGGDEGVGGGVLDVEEGDAGALAGEVGDEGRADAGCAAGDEDDAVRGGWGRWRIGWSCLSCGPREDFRDDGISPCAIRRATSATRGVSAGFGADWRSGGYS